MNATTFLFQQIINEEDSSVITNIKYRDIDNNICIKQLANIPFNLNNHQLTTEVSQALALCAKENDLPPLALPCLQNFQNQIRLDWLRNKKISNDNKKIFAASQSQVRTFQVNQFPEGSLVDVLDRTLMNKNMNVAIKGYGGFYTAFPNAGVMLSSSHGQRNQPKALIKSRR